MPNKIKPFLYTNLPHILNWFHTAHNPFIQDIFEDSAVSVSHNEIANDLQCSIEHYFPQLFNQPDNSDLIRHLGLSKRDLLKFRIPDKMKKTL